MPEFHSTSAVRDNPGKSRFELDAGTVVAVANYALKDGTLTFTHTEVPEAISGQGLGSRLVKGALDAARARGLKVVPRCPFVAGYIARHPEYAGLVE